jgi:hypothetical protein
MIYAEISQQVLAQLSPEMDRAEIPTLFHTLAYIALQRDAKEAAANVLTGGPDRQDHADVETTLSGLEASWGEEIAALRAEVARQQALAAQTSLALQERAGENFRYRGEPSHCTR